jgi:predicted nuclease of predicted toxin-antitoxin system
VTGGRPVLRFFLDESVPDSVGHVLMAEGHEVGFLNKSMARSSSDPLVCVIADINNAILVALDGDLKRIAQGYNVGARTFLKLGLLKLSCFEPDAARRVKEAMSLIEHEWN